MTGAATARRSGAKTARPVAARFARKSGLGGTLVGIFIGIALGLGLAAGVAFYLLKAGNPYQAAITAAARDTNKDTGKAGRAEPAAPDKPRFDFYKILPGVDEPKAAAKAAEHPTPDKATLDRAAAPDSAKAAVKVDIAKSDSARTEVAKADMAKTGAAKADLNAVIPQDKAVEPPRNPKAPERMWIQAGSFANQTEAENLKAQLALSGLEATVQPVTLQDKSMRYRVRLGPYDSIGELTRVKDDLTKHGVEVAVIKAP